MNPSRSYLASYALCVGALGGATLSPAAWAAEGWEVGFQPHIEVGVADYTLDVSSISQLGPGAGEALSTGKLSFGENMPTVSGGLTIFANRFFLDLAVQRMQTVNQHIGDSHTIISSGTSFGISTTQMSYDTDDFSRDEYTLSLGYGITEFVSVYAGYKSQYTNLNQLNGAGPVNLQTATGSVPFGTFMTSGDYKFEYDGPFVGGTTSWEMGNGALKGRLAFSAAVAFLQGSIEIKSESVSLTSNAGDPFPTQNISDIFDTSGDAVGVTLGASWLGQTDIAGLSYSVAINGYSYDFEADAQDGADIGEDVLQLKVGLAYAF